MNHHLRHHNHHRDATKRCGPKPLDTSITLQAGQVVFRLLCHVINAGGVIGSSGAIVKRLEHLTGAKILVEDTIPNCHERVINIIGDAAIDKKIAVDVRDENLIEGCEEVSQAQEGLIRVFERVLEVERNNGGVIGCKLLVGNGQIGAVMGKGGRIISEIQKTTGAKIRVLNKEQVPVCATPEERLIQIMGGMVSVKKALVAVSCRLQDRTPIESAVVHCGSLCNPCTAYSPSNSVDHSLIGLSLSADVDRVLTLDKDSGQQEVVFRLLCSTLTVGGLIGKGATIVKSLEKETGASIKIPAAVPGSNERVATIASLENPEQLYSPAQIAIVRVFARSIEVGFDHRLISGLGKGETITARLLVASNQTSCLIDEGGSVASDISTLTGVEIQLLGGNFIPSCATENDRVLQIIGEYENVKSALFEITGRLRNNIFSSLVSDRAGVGRYSFSAIPDRIPHESGNTISPGSDQFSGRYPFHQVDHLGFLPKFGAPHSPRLQPSQLKKMARGERKPPEDSVGGLTTSKGGLDHGSMGPAVVTNKTVEVVVPEQAFGSIYGENGSNLARLKEISGATVIMQDPRPGEQDGKVIISGVPDQIQVAESLLQAFIRV
ncbi:unnamed protein product [Ilex paraguariensis]|uniref:K Homology domain-containing protein n=1 Tax=Ilex paraguariensis TaxID=185542 RepID=A0ABC8SRT8_9AQUA